MAVDPRGSRLIGGRYRLLERLGFGGMGTVWRAHDEVVGRDVAIKEPRVQDHLTAEERATAYLRMQREARAAARIDHPSVVTVHDVVLQDERPWIVMELVRGPSLAELLDEGTLPPEEAARIGEAVAGALAAAHEAGVLHRDVKPANVLIGRYDRVVLTDFGVAQVEGEQKLTETGTFIGSPEYIAPERVLGHRPGPESDLWSLGVVLYEAVEGASPFRRQTTPSTLQAILLADPARPSRAGELADVIATMLRKDPSARPPAAEIIHGLGAVSQPPPKTQLMPVPIPEGGGDATAPRPGRFRRFIRRGKARYWLAAVGVLIVALVLLSPPGLPEGWKTFQEAKLHTSFGVPRDYQQSLDNESVAFTDPRGVFSITLQREKGRKTNGLGWANEWKAWYEAGADATMQDARPLVAKAEQQGREGGQMSTTFRYAAGDDTTTVYRRHELFVVTGEGYGYHLTVEMPDAKNQRAHGEWIYREIQKSLQIDDL